MNAAEVWALVLGAAVALAGTLLAQWSSLAYQTKRQREARKADFQRTTLLQLRDVLGEVDEAVRRAMRARYRLSLEFERDNQDPDEREGFFIANHPDLDALRSVTYRLRLLAVGVEHEPLRIAVGHITRFAWLGPRTAADQVAEDTWVTLIDVQNKAVDLLGEQLRKLP
jgi:hypothetical protein